MSVVTVCFCVDWRTRELTENDSIVDGKISNEKLLKVLSVVPFFYQKEK